MLNTETATQAFLLCSIFISTFAGKPVVDDFQKKFVVYTDHPVFKFLVIFSLLFMYTKNISSAIIGTSVIYIFYTLVDDDEMCDRIDK